MLMITGEKEGSPLLEACKAIIWNDTAGEFTPDFDHTEDDLQGIFDAFAKAINRSGVISADTMYEAFYDVARIHSKCATDWHIARGESCDDIFEKMAEQYRWVCTSHDGEDECDVNERIEYTKSNAESDYERCLDITTDAIFSELMNFGWEYGEWAMRLDPSLRETLAYNLYFGAVCENEYTSKEFTFGFGRGFESWGGASVPLFATDRMADKDCDDGGYFCYFDKSANDVIYYSIEEKGKPGKPRRIHYFGTAEDVIIKDMDPYEVRIEDGRLLLAEVV